jgi:hypothetical protein
VLRVAEKYVGMPVASDWITPLLKKPPGEADPVRFLFAVTVKPAVADPPIPKIPVGEITIALVRLASAAAFLT